MFWEPSESSSLPTVVFHKAQAGTNQTFARYYFVGKMDGQQKTSLEIDPNVPTFCWRWIRIGGFELVLPKKSSTFLLNFHQSQHPGSGFGLGSQAA